MNGIPAELLFVFVVIVFSLLEGIGRRAKARQQGEVGESPPSPRESTGEGRPRPEPVEVTRRDESGAPSKGSEGLIPEDVWEEILGLAKGTDSREVRPTPDEPKEISSWDSRRIEDETLEEIPPFEARSLEPLEPRPDIVRAEIQERPARRKVPPQSVPKVSIPAVAQASGAKSSRRIRRALFGTGSKEELQKAIVLKEVLGPPVGLREE